ncbi:MAG: D-TA family PLP-dependent enzyme [Candidatus Latescibacteria bacterium]|nr:D-TA family PLP-dependent enzyme [Candidatus Latescibacterota bacterium]
MIEYAGYKVGEPDSIETPAMLIFEEQVTHNLRLQCELAGGGQHLMVHFKTHKSAAIASKQLEAGIAGFKCATLKEMEVALEAGGKEVLLAYPLVQARKAERFCALAAGHAQAQVSAVASKLLHLEVLEQAAAAKGQRVRVMLDLDVGMHRTGLAPGDEALARYRQLAAMPHLEPAGLHAYDGHDHHTDPATREGQALEHLEEIRGFKGRLEAEGLSVPRVVAGGSFSFPYYARTGEVLGSPGTCVYWDAGYARLMPELPFRWAVLVLCQVVDSHPQLGTITTDLGYKAICGDPPLERRARLVGREDAVLQLQNEEHGVFRLEGELPAVGTYLLAVPGHVCPTTILYPGSYVIDAAGEVGDYYPHQARDRQ